MCSPKPLPFGIPISLAMVVMCASASYAHPSDSYPASPLPENYGQADYIYGPEYNYGDLTFAGQLVDADDLTHQERYIISGCVTGPSGPMMPWWQEVFFFCVSYYTQFRTLPDSISVEAIAAADGHPGDPSEYWMEMLKSPLTNEFPALNAATFAPGQVYCRVLTDAEMRHIASVNTYFNDLWFKSQWVNPETMEMEPVNAPKPALYLRIYGNTGVVYEGIHSLVYGN